MEKKSYGFWNIKENVFAEAKKYQTRKEFSDCCGSAYKAARVNGWLDEMEWFVRPIVYNKKWTKEKVFEESKKYRAKGEFAKNCGSAYGVALENDWLAEMTWFEEIRKSNGFWTKEKVFLEAKKYATKTQFSKSCGSAYEVARKNGWLDEMDWFTSPQKPNGFWTKENVFAEAKKYKTRTEFERGRGRAYNVACKNGWLDEMNWFISPQNPNGFWTKENVFTEAKKYKTRTEFQKGCSSAYVVARVNGWLDEMNWFKEVKKPGGYWTKENVFTEAKKYKTRNEFQKACSRAYNVAWKNGWLEEMDWFTSPQKPTGYWNIKENVFAESKKYETRTEFSDGCSGAYEVARKNGWLDELFPKAA